MQGDTTHATNDYSPGSDPSCTGFAESGNDLVYSFTAPADGQYVFTLSPVGYDAALYLLGVCPTAPDLSIGSCTGGSDVPGPGSEETVVVHLTANTSVYIVADGYTAADNGPFTLEVTTGATPPSNDQCTSPIALTEGTPVQGDTTSATNDYSPTQGDATCTQYDETGPDLVYTFTPSATGTYSFTLSQLSTGLDGAIYLLGACPTSSTVSSCLGGADRNGPGVNETFLANLTSGTTYVLVVDGYNQTKGRFTIEVDSVTPPTNDNCSAPIALTAGTTVQGDTTVAVDDYDPTSTSAQCTGTGNPGNDAVYSFTPTTSDTYQFTLTVSSRLASLYLLDSCPASGTAITSCLAGAVTAAPNTNATASFRAALTAGTTYFVVVDSPTAGSSGPFTLKVDTGLPPANDNCSAPQALTLGTPTSGDTSFALDDYNVQATSTNCTLNDSSGPDLVYSFTPPADGRYTITAAPTSTSSLDASLYVLSTCPSPGLINLCLGGDENGPQEPETLNMDMVANQTYFIVVDSTDGSSGPFTIEVSNAAAGPTNDTCSAPIALIQGVQTGGDTTNATNDYSPSSTAPGCPNQSNSGNDLVYSFTPAATGSYTFSLTPGGGAAGESIYLLSTCPAPGTNITSCLGGANTLVGVPLLSFTAVLTANVTYFVVVDSPYPNQGGLFGVSVDVSPPPPANDNCSAPQALTLSTPTSGDTSTALNDYNFSSGSCSGLTNVPGGDVVYSFTPTTDGRFQFTVTPTTSSSLIPAIYLLDTCPASNLALSSCVSGVQEQFASGPETTFANLTAATPIYVFVDSVGSPGGPFSIEVKPAQPAPPNDTCGGALAISAGGSVSGDTTSATADYNPSSPTCSPDFATGPDVVYSFTAPSTKAYTIMVSPTNSTYDPVLYVETACPFTDSSTCAAGSDSAGAGTSETVTLNATAGTTYFIVVDGWGQSAGPYTLSVSN